MTVGRGRQVAISAALTALAALGVTACSTSTRATATTTTSVRAATTTTNTLPSSTPTLAVTPTTIMPASAVGGTVLLPAVNQDPIVRVTLLSIIDPARGADQFASPVGSSRLVGVQLRITLGGSDRVALDPATATLLEDSQGNTYQPIGANINNCPAFNLGATTPPGKPKLGCLTFDVDTSAKVAHILYTPNGQFGNVSAQWDLK